MESDLLPERMAPMIITGIILPHLPRVCVGNDTYLSASYWHQVATTLLREMAA